MNTKQIEMILTVADTLNFTKAAEILYIAQPTLSYQIQTLENELHFKIFDRTQKSVVITPAGKSFIEAMRNLSLQYRTAVEQAQNYSERYSEDITISLPYRGSIHLLPEAMRKMKALHPETLIVPKFNWRESMNMFQKGEVDIFFGDYEIMKHMTGVKTVHFYDSHIYLVCDAGDRLAKKQVVTAEDLRGRTLMVGGGSQKQLKAVQDKVIETTHIPFFNSDDHETTLTNIAAGNAIVLAPGYLRDRNDHTFKWIPFDCHEILPCSLSIKESENRQSVNDFIRILLELYSKEKVFSL